MDSHYGRRRFLLGGSGLALGALTAGTLSGVESATADAEAAPATTPVRLSAGFGWELTNLNGDGADVYFQATRNMLLTFVDVDVAFMITSPPASQGFAEVLCVAGVSHGGPPNLGPAPQAYVELPASTDFGAVQLYNPANLTGPYNTQLAQGQVLALILKTWVPRDGTGSSTYRHVTVAPSATLNTGDYLVFHMDHAGVPGDCEMQVTLGYIGL